MRQMRKTDLIQNANDLRHGIPRARSSRETIFALGVMQRNSCLYLCKCPCAYSSNSIGWHRPFFTCKARIGFCLLLLRTYYYHVQARGKYESVESIIERDNERSHCNEKHRILGTHALMAMLNVREFGRRRCGECSDRIVTSRFTAVRHSLAPPQLKGIATEACKH